MEPEDQLKLLRKIWGRNRSGYVFLPWIPAEYAPTRRRKLEWREGPAFNWPEEHDKVLKHLADHADDDLYFSVQLFERPFRQAEFALASGRLYADLDEVDPRTIEEIYKPTYAWETSPKRYAAVWEISGFRHEATEAGMENHRLTSYLGADPSGWDTTQLLRVPGSMNNKASVIKAAGHPVRGKIVWANRERHNWEKFDDLPEVEAVRTIDVDTLSEELLESVDRYEVWGRVRLKVSSTVRSYMRMKDTEDLDRSEVAWQIECDLAEAGCSLAEIVAIIRPTVWNKYEGRQDELKRLFTEVTKALAKKAEREDDTGMLEPDEGEKPRIEDLKPWWEDEAYLNAPDPVWMVEGMVPEGGCGFIAGIPKSMKSWLGLDLAISVSEGIEFLDHEVSTPRNVLYIQQEDPNSLVLARHTIIASSKAPQRCPGSSVSDFNALMYVIVQSGFIGSDMGWQAWLDEVIATKDIGLVILDTLATVANGIDIDSGKEVKATMLDPIKVIARTRNCAVVFVHHMRKNAAADRAGQNMSGSGQIHAWADFGLYCIEKTNDNKLTFDKETKYTGTTRLTYHLDGLDNDPKEWLPREILHEEATISEAKIPKHARRNKAEREADREKRKVLRTTSERLAARDARRGIGLSLYEQQRQEGEENYRTVHTLTDEGMSVIEIARQTGLTKRTILEHLNK